MKTINIPANDPLTVILEYMKDKPFVGVLPSGSRLMFFPFPKDKTLDAEFKEILESSLADIETGRVS